MPILIKGSGGGKNPSGTRDITANGTYDVTDYASAKVAVPATEQATPSISVSDSGLITATAGGKSATHQLPTMGGGYMQPGTSDVVAMPSGYFATGYRYMSGDTDLVASNIKSGVEIFGVTGTLTEGAKVLILDEDLRGSDGLSISNYILATCNSDGSITFDLSIVFGNQMPGVVPSNLVGFGFYIDGDGMRGSVTSTKALGFYGGERNAHISALYTPDGQTEDVWGEFASASLSGYRLTVTPDLSTSCPTGFPSTFAASGIFVFT